MLEENELRLASHVAAQVTRNFYKYVDRADLYQELCLWMLEHPKRVEKWREHSGGRRFMRSDLFRRANKLAVRAKADRLGFNVEDIHWYKRGEVEHLLTLLAHDKADVVNGDQSEHVRPRVAGDPATGNNLLVGLVEVEVGLKQLPEDDRDLLVDVVVNGTDEQDAAYRRGITESSLRVRKHRALNKLVRLLNGQVLQPGKTLDGGPGARKSMSNAKAQAITQDDWSG